MECPARLSERAGSETSSGRVSHQDQEWFAKAAGGLQRAPADDVSYADADVVRQRVVRVVWCACACASEDVDVDVRE